METKIYPIDYDALEKGSTISVDELERITGKKSSSYAFALAVLGFVQKLQERLEDRGMECIVVQQKRGLRILTDIEATEYAYAEFEKHSRAMGRNLRRQLSVDPSGFNDTQKEDHDRRVHRMGFIYSAVKRARREVKHIEIPGPDTPRLVAPSPE